MFSLPDVQNAIAAPLSRIALRDVLVELYDLHNDINRLTRDAGLVIANIRYDPKPINYLDNVLIEADRRAVLGTLVSSAICEYPEKSEELQDAWESNTPG